MDEAILSKACAKCGAVKAICEFRKCSTEKDGRSRACKACAAAVERLWRLANPEKKKAACDAWRSAHQDEIKAYRETYLRPSRPRPKKEKIARVKSPRKSGKVWTAAWAKAHPERIKSNGVAYRIANQEKEQARNAAWRKANPEARRIHAQNRRARKLLAGGTLSKGLSAKLFKLQKGKCPCCRQPLDGDFHMDHIQPLALGGSNTDDNMQLLRSTCNQKKHAKSPIAFMQERGFLL